VTVENVNYQQLVQVGAADDFKKAVKTAVAKEAGDGITSDDVLVQLSAGSVMAKVTVKPKSGKPVSSLAKSKLHGKKAVSDAVVSGVSAVAGIKKASTGSITAFTWATCAECGKAIVTPAVQTKFSTCGITTGNMKTTCDCFTVMTTAYVGLQEKCCPLEGGDVEKDCHMAKIFTSPQYRCVSKAACAFPGFTRINDLFKPFPAGSGEYAKCMRKHNPASVTLMAFGEDTTCAPLQRDRDVAEDLKGCCTKQGAPSICADAAKFFAFQAKCAYDEYKCKP